MRYITYIGAKGGEGAAAPERDRFARACTGVGAGATRCVRACVRACVTLRGVGKAENVKCI